MNTSFLLGVEELITWLFDHEEEFVNDLCGKDIFSADNIFISGGLVFVRDNYIYGTGNNVYIPINKVIDWVSDHKDGY